MKRIRQESYRVLVLLAAVFLLVTFNQIYQFHQDPRLADVPKSNPLLLLLTLPLVALIWVVRAEVQARCFQYALGAVSDLKYNPERRVERAYSFCKWYVDVPYYVMTTALSFYILRGESNLPSWMGGSGDCSQNYRRFYQKSQQADLIDLIYILELSQHLYSLAKHLLQPSPEGNRKYAETLIHHSMAFLLILLSYLANYQLVGVMVLLTHNASDLLLIVGRYILDLRNIPNWLSNGASATGFLGWVYFRLLCFPVCAIGSGAREFGNPENILRERPGAEVLWTTTVLLMGMMVGLLGMHLFWTYFIVATFVRQTCKRRVQVNYDE
jgi:hypothetical protein